jgi:DNA-binding CsgD family transcriptional regulator
MTSLPHSVHSIGMETVRRLVSPVLVGRDPLLDLVTARLAEVQAGSGRILFLAGEAGIGKSRLLGVVERRAAAGGFRVARGTTFPRDLHVPAAPLLDLARSLAGDEKMAGLGVRIEMRLTAGTGRGEDAGDTEEGPSGDAHRRRRLLILDAADLLLETALGGPALLALEDLHWADDLTLEILASLAGRLEGVPLLVVATYRSDELYPRLPMREWRTFLLGRRLAEEARLERLTTDQTGMMAMLLAGDGLPAPRALVEAVHARADGVPLYIEEIIAALRETRTGFGEDAGDGEGADGARPSVPETLETAVLDRLARRSEAGRRAARAGAVIGRSFELELLAAVLETDPAALADPLAELQDHFFLVPRGTSRHDFRHALIRDAIHNRIPGPERRALHARVAELAATGISQLSDASLSVHFEEAGRRAGAYHTALAAARAAAGLSSTREALELYRRALRNAPPDLPRADQGDLLAEAGEAAAGADENTEAAIRFEAARARYLEAGEPVRAAGMLPPLVAVRHLLGDDLDARVGRLHAGLEELAQLSAEPGDTIDPAVAGVRGRLHAALAAAHMLVRRLDDGLRHGEEAAAHLAAAGDEAAELDRLVTVGAILVFAGRMDAGWSMLEGAVGRAREAGREAQAARAYRMLGSASSVLVEYGRGERWLREGIDYAERVELWNHRHYLAAHLGHVLWALGRIEESRTVASQALADGRGGITTRITALHVLGYVALSEGDIDGVHAALDEALALGERMRELQRIAPARWGLAEAALLADKPAAAVEGCRRGLEESAALEDAAYLFPFLLTGTRAYLALADPAGAESWLDDVRPHLLRRSIPGTLPALEHAAGLIHLAAGSTGRALDALTAAAGAWTARGRTFEGAAAQLDVAMCHLRANRPAEAVRIAALVKDADGQGHPVLARRAADVLALAQRRGGVTEPWAPLTAREFEVARRIMNGATNREVAAELGIATKTVAAHVEHILAKLGVARRAEIAAWAARIGAGAQERGDQAN